MMSCIQMASFRPHFNLKVSHPNSRGFPPTTRVFADGILTLPSRYPKLSIHVPIYKRHTVVCVFGDKEKPGTNNQDPPWKGVQKAFENMGQKLSVEEMLRKQIGKQGYDSEELGGGGSPPGGGGGDGDGDDGGSAGFGEPEEESSADKLDETLNIIAALSTLIILYLYCLFSPEIQALVKDYSRYVSTGKKSQRLDTFINMLERLWKVMTGSKPWMVEKEDIMTLEEAIISADTWYDGPGKYRKMVNAYMASRAGDPDIGVEEADEYTQFWRDKYNEFKRSEESSSGDVKEEDGDEDGDEDFYEEIDDKEDDDDDDEERDDKEDRLEERDCKDDGYEVDEYGYVECFEENLLNEDDKDKARSSAATGADDNESDYDSDDNDNRYSY